MNHLSKIFVAGHSGLLGSSLVKSLTNLGHSNLVLRSHRELDLEIYDEVERLFIQEKPEYVFLAAAKVGGIVANRDNSGDFIRKNLQIQTNVIHLAKKYSVKRLVFFASACNYPKYCSVPIREEDLFNGHLESTNKAYAVAKLAGIAMCEAYNSQYGTEFITLIPTNLYGEKDNFDLQHSHVLPALVRKFVEAMQNNQEKVIVWGTGKATRDFLFVDDLAMAAIDVANLPELTSHQFVMNVGSGLSISIRDLAKKVSEIVGFKGEIEFDSSLPDGTPERYMDIKRISAIGWAPTIGLQEGLERVVEHYSEQMKHVSV